MKCWMVLLFYSCVLCFSEVAWAQYNQRTAKSCDCDGTCPSSASNNSRATGTVPRSDEPSEPTFDLAPEFKWKEKPPNVFPPLSLEEWQVRPNSREFDALFSGALELDASSISDRHVPSKSNEEKLIALFAERSIPSIGEPYAVKTEVIETLIREEDASSLFDAIRLPEKEAVQPFNENGPDFMPADPDMGAGGTLSDIVKQTNPNDVARCKVAVEQSG